MTSQRTQQGFTLVEMIVVMVITGIIGGMVAVFLKAPVQGYVDSARRAELTDVADTALRRIGRDLRLALPNSVRVAGTCDGTGSCFIEYLPTKGGGRYRGGPGGTDNQLLFTAADNGFEVLGLMPPVAAGDHIAVYNLGIAGADAYAGNTLATHNRRAVSAAGVGSISIASANKLPFDSPGQRFHVITTPVSYVCDGAGALWRYWGYAIQDVQTKTDTVAELELLPGYQKARLATNVSTCLFKYQANVVAQRSGLVTMFLGMTKDGESVTLYSAAHVSNQP